MLGAVEEATATLSSLEIVGKGLVITEEVITEVKANVNNLINRLDLRKISDENELAGIIRRNLKNYLFNATKKNPMILPIVMVV